MQDMVFFPGSSEHILINYLPVTEMAGLWQCPHLLCDFGISLSKWLLVNAGSGIQWSQACVSVSTQLNVPLLP